MLVCRGEVRESGLTGVTRNHVSPCGSGGSNPPLSAIQSVLFTYNLEMAANPRGTRRFCAQCEPEKAISLEIGRIPRVFSPREEKTGRFRVRTLSGRPSPKHRLSETGGPETLVDPERV